MRMKRFPELQLTNGVIFQRLLADCRAGKIDRILVKSISRFARNTIDCIQTVREFKQLGIAVEFEKEDIDTGKIGSEMLLSILGSAAQEESHSISKNLKWSYRRRMKSGDFITRNAPLGYFLKNGTLIPDPQEVPIVEYIFSSYLAGKSIEEIATEINAMEIEISGKKTKRWHRSTIRYVLLNEKYIGDALVQKWFTPDELPLKHQRNDGKVSQYYIKNSHPAIIPRDIFETVQQLLKQKAKQYVSKTPKRSFPLSRTMQCALCGSTFRRRPSTKAIRWICYQHLQSKDLCPMEIVKEEEALPTIWIPHD